MRLDGDFTYSLDEAAAIKAWMIICLTQTRSRLCLRGNKPNVTQRSNGIALQRQFIPSIVRAELLFGWQNSPHHASRIGELRRFLAALPSLAFDDAAAEEYGRLRAYPSRIGLMIGPNDLMIPSIALAHDLVLVTHNVGEFSRVPSLRIEDWESPAS